MNKNTENIYNELRSFLAVHLAGLHKDAQEQAHLASQAGELAADLRATSKRKKMELDEAKAEADKNIRNDPDKFGLSKTTEKAVELAINLHEDVQAARIDSIEADLDADKASSLANAYEHRKSMLKNEVQLYLGNYWGDVEVKEAEMQEAKAGAFDQTEKRVEERRKQKKEQKNESANVDD